jgi:hypothetical protein
MAKKVLLTRPLAGFSPLRLLVVSEYVRQHR